jgi:hypothetical protein
MGISTWVMIFFDINKSLHPGLLVRLGRYLDIIRLPGLPPLQLLSIVPDAEQTWKYR